MTLKAYVFPKFETAKNVVREVSKKHCFRRTFDKLHDKPSQRLMKSEGQRQYEIY